MGIGDRNERHEAQKLNTHKGKVLRFIEDLAVPEDNPFVKTAAALPEIWSYGHRNPRIFRRIGHDQIKREL
jgi:glucose/arabinose dehydrogenase